MQDLRVKLIQFDQKWEDKLFNFNKIEELIEKDGIQADLILLPEMFSTGFSMNSDLVETMDGKSVKYLTSLADQFDCFIGATLSILDQKKYYNRFVIVDKNGVQSYYDKRHLFSLGKENKVFSPGNKKVIFELNNWRFCLQICYDLRFPIFSRNDKKNPYDALIYLANWPKKRIFAWESLLVARAIENQSYVLGVNRIGQDGNKLNYSGGTRIIDSLGKVISKAEINEEVCINFVLNKQEIVKNREQLPFLSDSDNYSIESIN